MVNLYKKCTTDFLECVRQRIASHQPATTVPSEDKTLDPPVPAHANQLAAPQERGGREAGKAAEAEEVRAQVCGSWGSDILFLFEMFPDVDPSKIHEQASNPQMSGYREFL
jgi:hypothetical protein